MLLLLLLFSITYHCIIPYNDITIVIDSNSFEYMIGDDTCNRTWSIQFFTICDVNLIALLLLLVYVFTV